MKLPRSVRDLAARDLEIGKLQSQLTAMTSDRDATARLYAASREVRKNLTGAHAAAVEAAYREGYETGEYDATHPAAPRHKQPGRIGEAWLASYARKAGGAP